MKQIKLTEEHLRKMVREALKEAIVNQFTPYSEEDRRRNFSPFFGGDNRTPEERNPSFAKAKRDAEDRMRRKKANQQPKD